MVVAGVLVCLVPACGSDGGSQAEMQPAVTAMRVEPDAQGWLNVSVPSAKGVFGVRVGWQLERREALLAFITEGYRALDVDDVKVRLVMPEHGHDGLGPPKVVPAPPTVGRWQVTDLAPSMSGDWELRIDATVQGKTDRATLYLHFPASALEPMGAHDHS